MCECFDLGLVRRAKMPVESPNPVWSYPGTLTSSTNADDAESTVHVFAEALPEDVAKVRRVVVDGPRKMEFCSETLTHWLVEPTFCGARREILY